MNGTLIANRINYNFKEFDLLNAVLITLRESGRLAPLESLGSDREPAGVNLDELGRMF